jgi:hypothetical protein
MDSPNEVVEKKQCTKSKSNANKKTKPKTVLIKCDKCCVEKVLREIVTKTEKYKKKYYKKQICQECFPTYCSTTTQKGLNYRIKKLLARRLRQITNKTDTTMNYIGCNIQYVREWIEYNFTDEMNWDNYGSYWSIDHVIPVSNFDLTLENNKFKCWNWSNLTPLPLLKNTSDSFLVPPFISEAKKVEKLEKFKEEGSTTKWFSKEFILNKEFAEIKANINSF